MRCWSTITSTTAATRAPGCSSRSTAASCSRRVPCSTRLRRRCRRRSTGNERAALDAGVIVFEAMQDAELFPEHNEMSFYTWGESDCCLPKGATEATLLGTFDNLKIGDVLIFQEMVGPQTGNKSDADVRHRCAVRLTRVTTRDAAGKLLVDPLFEKGTGKPITSAAQQPTPVTEIQWSSGRRAAVSRVHLEHVPGLATEAAKPHRRQQGVRQRRAGGPRRDAEGHRSRNRTAPLALLPASAGRRPLPACTPGTIAAAFPARRARQPDHAGRPAASRRAARSRPRSCTCSPTASSR